MIRGSVSNMARDEERIHIERWHSSDNRQEVHFFKAGDQKIYVAGFNPQLIPEEKIRTILREAGFDI